MTLKAPTARRKFRGAWDEIDYLRGKLLYWLYRREAPSKARPFAERLHRALERAESSETAILGHECRSLICESKGLFAQAVEHRRREIAAIRRLRRIAAEDPKARIAARDYGVDDLSDRLDLLATLLHADGQLDRAIETLEESKDLCLANSIPFEGAGLLNEYRREEMASRDR